MTTKLDERRTVLPPSDLEPILDLSKFLEQADGPAVLVGPDGQQVSLPESVFEVLAQVVGAMRVGRAITVAPVDQSLTTQEAADFLGISRPTLVKVLESGRVPFTRPTGGRHRRVLLKDLMEYQRATRQDRRETLAGMTRDAVEDGLYDEDVDYTEALRAARGKRD
ncbi:excisionase family DNA-binding protein [Propionibacteriaceae bacterium G1746]